MDEILQIILNKKIEEFYKKVMLHKSIIIKNAHRIQRREFYTKDQLLKTIHSLNISSLSLVDAMLFSIREFHSDFIKQLLEIKKENQNDHVIR